MNRQHSAKSSDDNNGASPLSLLVHAADSQRSSGKKGGKPDNGSNQRESPRIPEGAPSSSLDEHMAQRQAAARVEALHHQGLLSQLRGGNLGDGDFLQQNAALVAAQQQQQAAALALASDIRTAVAAAQLRQAAQFQNQDLILARTAALQQLGLGGHGGMEQLHQELELHRLEEFERRQLLAAAGGGNGGPLGAIAVRQQMDLQEHQMRQEQLDRHLGGVGGGNESMLDRAGLRATADNSGARGSSADGGNKDSFQKTPGSVVVPCRARGMPMDHNFKTAYFVIPENVEHGEELICSYFACRNAGIKFRYCTHCKVPVAKRNFRKRHKHGKSNTGNDPDEDGSLEDEEEPMPKGKKDVDEEPPKPVYSQQIHKKMEIPSKVEAKETSKKNKGAKESRMVSDDPDGPSLPPISHQYRPNISADRERLWAQLLAKRPPTKDGEAVSAWLMEVLSVSDLDTPLKANGQAQPAPVISLPFKNAGTPTDAAQLAAASFTNKAVMKAKESEGPIVKKKRPLAVRERDDDEHDAGEIDGPRDGEHGGSPTTKGSSEKKDVGSFAEWKDRKKHKGLPKKGAVFPGRGIPLKGKPE